MPDENASVNATRIELNTIIKNHKFQLSCCLKEETFIFFLFTYMLNLETFSVIPYLTLRLRF